MLELLRHVGFLLMMGLSLPLHAAQPYGPTAEEVKMLPDYCQNPEQWKVILGSGWNNHTCYGINWINRYYKSRTISQKRFSLQNAIGDFNYSVDKLPPDYALLPEIYMYRGITYGLMDRVGEAVADLQKAIDMNPKLTRAYNELADHYEIKLSQRDKALETITEGLRHNPGTTSLQRRYTRLGGKLPYPEPLPPPEPAVAGTPPAPAQGAAPETVPAVAPVEAPVEKADAAADTEKPKIGTPKNPYCRFCPD
jgi:tetratricopeptide (TPR) repeat protein